MVWYNPPLPLESFPKNGDTEVALETVIRVTFGVDLDATCATSALRVVDREGRVVPGTVRYADRELSFQPAAPLNPNANYHVTVLAGTSNPRAGVWSATGMPLPTDWDFSFTTLRAAALPPPELQSPADGSVISSAGSLAFSWLPVPGANQYQLQISQSPQFLSLVYPLTDGSIPETRIEIGVELPEGALFWRVRAGNDTSWSAWSEVRRFQIASNLMPEPVPGVEGPTAEMIAPRDGELNVPAPLRLVRIRFTHVDASQIDASWFSLIEDDLTTGTQKVISAKQVVCEPQVDGSVMVDFVFGE